MAQGMDIETYFGFFAKSVFTAIAASVGSQSGKKVTLEGLELLSTNTLKLRWGDVTTVMIPKLAEPGDLPFLFALTEADAGVLAALAGERTSMQRMMEQAVSTAVEPFNFISKTRNRLTGLQFSRNVTGLTAHHLNGEVAYTMAVGKLRAAGGQDFGLRLLVTAAGRDLIEDRATQGSTQRALFSVNQGSYVCRPQWEPPPPPPGLEEGTEVSEAELNAWIQSFFALNDGSLPPKLFKQPVAFLTRRCEPAELKEAVEKAGGLTVARMLLNEEKGQELFALVPPEAEKSLLTLSKSGQEKFLADFFRVSFSEPAGLWGRFGGTAMKWRVLALRKIPADALPSITSRIEGGGFTVRQEARFDQGRLTWYLAIAPHTWHFLLRITAQAISREVEGTPDRKAIFAATGWDKGGVPWPALLSFCSDRDLQDVVRLLNQAKMQEPFMAAVADMLDEAGRTRWLQALPVMLRERAEAYELAEGEAVQRQKTLSQALIGLNRARRLPEGKLSDWLRLYTEFHWARRQNLIDRLLPLRHLVYGMDRDSLSRLLFDEKNDVLTMIMCGAEFSVLDQVRRAISPSYAVRLLEDVGVKRGVTTAYSVQEAQLQLYRRCHEGIAQGRYLLRATAAERLTQLVRWLDEGG